MSAIDDTPQNRNFLSPLNFKFQIKKCPNVNFFVQKVNLPLITLGTPEVPNPFVQYPVPGDQLKFGNLELEFKLDEDWQNYLEIYAWITSLGFPESFDQFKQAEMSQNNKDLSGEGIYSDISLISLTSTRKANYEITFIDAFPVTLAPVVFDTTDESVDYVTAHTTFRYSYYKIKKI